MRANASVTVTRMNPIERCRLCSGVAGVTFVRLRLFDVPTTDEVWSDKFGNGEVSGSHELPILLRGDL